MKSKIKAAQALFLAEVERILKVWIYSVFVISCECWSAAAGSSLVTAERSCRDSWQGDSTLSIEPGTRSTALFNTQLSLYIIQPMFDTHFKGQKGLFSDSLIENKTL